MNSKTARRLRRVANLAASQVPGIGFNTRYLDHSPPSLFHTGETKKMANCSRLLYKDLKAQYKQALQNS